MPASIRVESGISAGTSYWVDRPVLRIGSDPQCEVCLPSAELAPHALTLEYRAGQYRAYNRGTGPIRVGATVLPAGGNGVWEADETVHLPGDLRLVLDIDGDPQPSPRAESRAGEPLTIEAGAATYDVAGATLGEATAKKSSRTMVQLGVIGSCMLLMVAFLTMGKGEQPAQAQLPPFQTIIEKLIAEGEPSRQLRHRLQFAESAVVRGLYGFAQVRYLRLRNRMMQQNDAGAAKEREGRQLARAYVEYRIGQLR